MAITYEKVFFRCKQITNDTKEFSIFRFVENRICVQAVHLPRINVLCLNFIKGCTSLEASNLSSYSSSFASSNFPSSLGSQPQPKLTTSRFI